VEEICLDKETVLILFVSCNNDKTSWRYC